MITIFPDVNARQQDYAGLLPDQMLLTDVFYTLQGEGPFAGRPAVFVRLAGCNLGAKQSCPWCDTDFRFVRGRVLTVTDVRIQAECVLGVRAEPIRKLAVLTGGEPLLQPGTPQLVQEFLRHGWQVQIETNGYFWSEDMHRLKQQHLNWLTIVVSPKVNAAGIYPPIRPQLLADSDCLKVVVDADPKSAYHKPPAYLHEYGDLAKPIYISPINHYRREPKLGEPVGPWRSDSPLDLVRCERNHVYAASLAQERGFRLSLQTHLFAEVP